MRITGRTGRFTDGVEPLLAHVLKNVLGRCKSLVPIFGGQAAGSGMDGSGDLLALRGDLCFPIEVKTRAEKKVHLSGQK